MDSAKAAKEAEIPQAMSGLNQAINVLDGEISGLGEKIKTAMAQKPAQEPKAPSAIGYGYTSELAQRIGDLTINVNAILNRVRDYRRDCEL